MVMYHILLVLIIIGYLIIYSLCRIAAKADEDMERAMQGREIEIIKRPIKPRVETCDAECVGMV